MCLSVPVFLCHRAVNTCEASLHALWTLKGFTQVHAGVVTALATPVAALLPTTHPMR